VAARLVVSETLAARGGLEGSVFAWGDDHFPDGSPMANTWQGDSSTSHLGFRCIVRLQPEGE